MCITEEEWEPIARELRKAGRSDAEISALRPKEVKSRKNGKRDEYKRTVTEYINLHGKFPPKEVWTKFPQCPESSSSQRELNTRIRKKHSKDTGKEFKYENGVHKVENLEVDPEHERALKLLRERGRIDLVQQGLPRNAKIHNYLLSHTDVEEVGTGIFQYRMIKEEEE